MQNKNTGMDFPIIFELNKKNNFELYQKNFIPDFDIIKYCPFLFATWAYWHCRSAIVPFTKKLFCSRVLFELSEAWNQDCIRAVVPCAILVACHIVYIIFILLFYQLDEDVIRSPLRIVSYQMEILPRVFFYFYVRIKICFYIS